MSLCQCRFDGLSVWRKPVVVAIATAAVSVVLAGCASKNTPAPQARVYAPPAKVAAYQRKILIEDDGIEEQTPPLRRKKVVPDDPTEPFSPNYGRSRTLKRSDASASPVYDANGLPRGGRHARPSRASGT